jgi:hypothetical protein
MKRTLGIVAFAACLASCSDEELSVPVAAMVSYPKAVPDSVIVAVGEIASIDVKANDAGTVSDDPIQLLSNPMTRWKRTLVRYAATETGSDTFS